MDGLVSQGDVSVWSPLNFSERKVLIFGIDGATWKVLKPAVDDGLMPALKGLMESGSWGILRSTLPAITPAAWTSFQTGSNPVRNGIVDFFHWDREQKSLRPVDIRGIPETLWERAGNEGRRVGIINLPMTYPPKPVNGFMVTGLMTPTLQSEFTYPASLAQRLLEAVPEYSIFHLETAVTESDRENLDAFLDWISSVIVNRGRAACWLLQEEPVDLLMVHFQASDVLQHVLWHYLDPDHPLFDRAKNREIVRRFFGTLDQQIEVISYSFGRHTSTPWLTAVVSDHGFQRHDRRFNLWRWLQENGFLKLDLTASADPPVDWKASRAFSTGRSNEAFIYLLESKMELRQATAERLVEMLTSLCDPDTGERVISAVHLLETLDSGYGARSLPDLVVEPHGHYSVTGLYEKNEETYSTVVPGSDFHAGRHHPEGILVLTGPGIKPRSDLEIDLIDIAPTLLSYLGVHPGEEMDGRVRHGLFQEGILLRDNGHHRPAGGSLSAGSGDEKMDHIEGEVYTAEEKEIIERRLKDLGYL